MNKELLIELQGRHISVITKGIPHPSSGLLEVVGDSYIVINPKSPKVEKVIIEIDQIVSVLVGKNDEVKKNEIRQRARNTEFYSYGQ